MTNEWPARVRTFFRWWSTFSSRRPKNVFALIFKILPNARIRWRDVGLGLRRGELLWVYYSSQILLFGAEFTQVYADRCGAHIAPDKYAVRVERQEIEKPRR